MEPMGQIIDRRCVQVTPAPEERREQKRGDTVEAGRQFGRNTSHCRAMLRALTGNLIAHERVETTDAKAKQRGAWRSG